MTNSEADLSKQITKSKIWYLEGIRGLAAFMVVIHHYLLAFYPAQANGKLSDAHLGIIELWYHSSPFIFLTNGRFFVYIFFILSGYVLSKKFIEKPNRDYLKSAVIRRIPRLYIPVAFSLIVAFILIRLSFDFNIQAGILTKSAWLQALHGNPSMSHFFKSLLYKAFFHYDNSYNTVLWSITFELYGSFMVFAGLWLSSYVKTPLILFSLIFMVLVFTGEYEYGSFFLGVILNYWRNIEFKSAFLNRALIVFLIALGLFLGGFPHVYYTTPSISDTFYRFLNYDFIITKHGLINSIGAFMIVLAVQQSIKLQNFFSSNILDFLGSISFSMYLIHALILQSFSSFIFIKLDGVLNYNAAFLVTFISSLTLIMLISYRMTISVDKRSVRIAQYFNSLYNNLPTNKRNTEASKLV
jgi:peptidoglycan/LPS O-acetylase OafA/YrhL